MLHFWLVNGRIFNSSEATGSVFSRFHWCLVISPLQSAQSLTLTFFKTLEPTSIYLLFLFGLLFFHLTSTGDDDILDMAE